jgi:hypothetical protein
MMGVRFRPVLSVRFVFDVFDVFAGWLGGGDGRGEMGGRGKVLFVCGM